MTRRRDKFAVTHWRRGSLDPDDCFVLVPPRDPAAVAAIRAYAGATADPVLAAELTGWADELEGGPAMPDAQDLARIYHWTAVLAEQVRSGTMSVETALQRIAGHALALKWEEP